VFARLITAAGGASRGMGWVARTLMTWPTSSLHDEVEAELSRTGEFSAIPDIGAKIAENAARVAAQFHAITHGPGGSIDAATMEGAAAVAIWHLNEASHCWNERQTDGRYQRRVALDVDVAAIRETD
jgi:hypothetical protein